MQNAFLGFRRRDGPFRKVVEHLGMPFGVQDIKVGDMICH